MAKSAGPGKCVHCLRDVSERNWDHVLPESWYPDTTPADMEKWTVPSCVKCNSDYGKLEQDLLLRFGLCLDPEDHAAQGIVDKTLRSISPEYGRDSRDRQARLKARNKILRDMVQFSELPSHGILPNFGPSEQTRPDELYCVRINKSDIERLMAKIIRGIVFVQDGIFIDENYDLSVHLLDDEGAKPVVAMIDQYGVQLHRGPGLLVRKAVVPEDRRVGLYAVEVWQRTKMYAAVIPKDSTNVASNVS